MALKLLLVGAGGAIGSILRYLVGGWVQTWVSPSTFPWGTAAINISGCFIIGILGGFMARDLLSSNARLVLMIGVCGGYTTYSSYGYETLQMMQTPGQMPLALGNVALQTALGLLAVWAGFALAKAM